MGATKSQLYIGFSTHQGEFWVEKDKSQSAHCPDKHPLKGHEKYCPECGAKVTRITGRKPSPILDYLADKTGLTPNQVWVSLNSLGLPLGSYTLMLFNSASVQMEESGRFTPSKSVPHMLGVRLGEAGTNINGVTPIWQISDIAQVFQALHQLLHESFNGLPVWDYRDRPVAMHLIHYVEYEDNGWDY